MNHVAVSMQEHCLMINFTNHKSLFLRKKRGGGGLSKGEKVCAEKHLGILRENKSRVTFSCVCVCVNGGENEASGQRDHWGVGVVEEAEE